MFWFFFFFFFSSRRRHTRLQGDWSSDVCSSDLLAVAIDDGTRDRACLIELQIDDALLSRSERDRRAEREGTEQVAPCRSEERRVGKECRPWCAPADQNEKIGIRMICRV